MASHKENNDVLMLPISDSSSRTKPFTPRSRSVSLANTSSTIDGLDSSSHNNRQAAQNPTSRDTVDFTSRAKGFADRYLPKIPNLPSKVVQSWNKGFAISCLLPIFVDPLFVFLIHVKRDHKCLSINMRWAHIYAIVKCLTDLLFLRYLMLQCRMAYIAPEFTAIVARRFFRGKLLVDLYIGLPLAQMLIYWFIPAYLSQYGANNAKNIVLGFVLTQYIPRLYKLRPFLVGETPTGFMFKSNWAFFFINLSTFMLAGHFIGSCWYLFGLQRVNQCLRDACSHANNTVPECKELIDCDRNIGVVSEIIEILGLPAWKDNANANACFQEDGFHYGIYSKAVKLTTDSNPFNRYIYSLFWGFQQISTLAGNQVPSYYLWEVIFTMVIVGLGLLLVALLIGNMQQFLQGVCRRNLEITLRRRDVEKWMSHRCLPEVIRERVQDAERFNWAVTRGVNEEMLFQNMPDDIQRDIRRHLFNFLDKVSIFSGMDVLVLDAIRGRLKQKIYIKNSTVLYIGDLVDKMVFIVSGEMESTGEDGIVLPLSKGDVCGEELLHFLERSSVNSDDTMIRLPSKIMLSNRKITCVTNVEAFSLSVADLEDVTNLFSRFLSHRVQRADSSGLEIPKETTS